MLHIHRAERADALVGALGSVLAEPPEDPLASEVVAVPTRGIERWLSQRLASLLGAAPGRADGVCANVVFPFPERLLAAALDAASPLAPLEAAGATRPPGALSLEPYPDPWSPRRAVWPLLEVVEECAAEPWLELLVSHLQRGPGQRFAALRHVADLFDRYAVHRPAMVRAWAGGSGSDASGAALAPDRAWQPELWRRLRARIGVPSSAERLIEAVEALRAGEVAIDLPARVSLFGLTRLPPSYLEVLRALAVRRDVHLYLLHPSSALWAEVAGQAAAATGSGARAGAGVVPRLRRADPTAALARHPLLASWGRDAREMQLVLEAGDGEGVPGLPGEGEPAPGAPPPGAPAPGAPAVSAAPRQTGTTLLARIQADVSENRRPQGEPPAGQADERLVLEPDDDSIRVHDCHGRGRQVEVVRDAILHLLAADPTLEPRDVIVMCPDIESWAPLIRASFDVGGPPGRAGPSGQPGPPGPTAGVTAPTPAAATPSGPRSAAKAAPDDDSTTARVDLRARLADRSLRQTNPLLGVVSRLLDLAGSRVTASQVLDLAAMAPVRRRFGFDDAELARLRQWVGDSGVRWGIDGAHRAPYGLELLEANTWRAGLDRLLLGVAVSEGQRQLVGGVLPLEDVASNDVDLAGRLCELVERVATTLDELARTGEEQELPISSWAEALRGGLDRLALAAEAERWQRLQVDRLLAEVAGEAVSGILGAGPPVPIVLAELRSLLADRLRGRPTRANFRTGHLTICTLVPMRSVPHRVVCLLGMDDGAFPRHSVEDGDDLVGAEPWVGDRDARSEDRQLLLDAVLAAQEHLVVTYRGRDERTNAARPPCVPVGELLDVVDATARRAPPAAGPARSQVLVRHPLQPFDARCFVAGALVPATPWSFDAVNLRGARAAAGERSAPGPFLAGALPPLEDEVVELATLVRFLRRPVGELLRRRLGLRLGDDDPEPLDEVPIELDGLRLHEVGERLLQGRLAGLDRAACEAAERARGTLPPGILADERLAACGPIVESLLAAWREHVPPGARRDTLDVHVVLGNGAVLVGSVAGVYRDALCGVGYARLAPARRLAAWAQLLALAASGSPVSQAVTIGRAASRGDGNDERIACSRLEPGEDAPALLEQLVELYRRGMREPLPLFCRTSEAWAAARRRDQDAVRAARAAWSGAGPFSYGESSDEEHALVLGGAALEDLLAEAPGAGESGEGWAAEETTRLGRLARRLWDPILSSEQLSER